MIILGKTILFSLALWATIAFIVDVIEKIIIYYKKDEDELHLLYTHGYLSTINERLLTICVLLWTGFYLINQF